MKNYTNLEQSRTLCKILPIESADMFYSDILIDKKHKYNPHYLETYGFKTFEDTKPKESKHLSFLPCWTLTALLNIMPKDESIECSISFGYYNSKGEYIKKWLCAFEKEGETTDDYIIETFDGDNPVDACYQMVIRLKEKNLL